MNNKPKIVIKHSHIEINNYELGDSSQLEYFFSIYDPLRHRSYFKAIEYNEEEKKLLLPRGIDISYLENTFCCDAYLDTHHDDYIDNPEPIPIKYLTRDNKQLEVLKFVLGKDKYFYTSKHSQLSVNCNTGFGKTFVTIASICFTKHRAIIITSAIEWLEQWKNKILEYTPLNESDIYMITGAPSIDKILCRDPLKYKVFLASHSTIKSYGDKHGWKSIDALFKYLKCAMKVYDEAHLYFDNIMKIDFHSNLMKTIYLTATPERSNRDENAIYQLCFKNVPSIDLFDENQDPHTHYMSIHFNSHPTPYDVSNCKNAYGFDRITYTNYLATKDSFYMIVNILIDMLMNTPGKVLIYIGTNKAIKLVYDHIINQFPFLANSVGIYTSITKENKIEQQYKKFILSTTKSAGAASDIKDLACTVNLAEPFKSPVLARQTLGRTRDDETLYIDLVDEGFYFTKKYYKEKLPVFNRYAKSIRSIAMSDEELEQRNADVIEKYNVNRVMCGRVFKE